MTQLKNSTSSKCYKSHNAHASISQAYLGKTDLGMDIQKSTENQPGSLRLCQKYMMITLGFRFINTTCVISVFVCSCYFFRYKQVNSFQQSISGPFMTHQFWYSQNSYKIWSYMHLPDRVLVLVFKKAIYFRESSIGSKTFLQPVFLLPPVPQTLALIK